MKQKHNLRQIESEGTGRNMLHIILGILKIAGIILGFLLLLLIMLILGFLFVPVRYRLEGSWINRQMHARVNISWLLHIVSLKIFADGTGGPEVRIRIAGIPLPFFGAGTKKNRKTEFKVERESGAEYIPEKIEKHEESVKQEENVKPEESRITAESGGSESGREPEGNEEPPGKDVLKKIRYKFSAVCDKIKQIIDRIKRGLGFLVSLPEKIGRLSEKVGNAFRKPGELLLMAEEYQLKEILSGILGELIYLMKHFGPKRIRGFLRMGTGDPALTGQLAGLIYILLPAKADRFVFTPEFNEAVFEADVICTGHLRGVHLIRVAWNVFRNKKLRRLIKKVRKGK